MKGIVTIVAVGALLSACTFHGHTRRVQYGNPDVHPRRTHVHTDRCGCDEVWVEDDVWVQEDVWVVCEEPAPRPRPEPVYRPRQPEVVVISDGPAPHWRPRLPQVCERGCRRDTNCEHTRETPERVVIVDRTTPPPPIQHSTPPTPVDPATPPPVPCELSVPVDLDGPAPVVIEREDPLPWHKKKGLPPGHEKKGLPPGFEKNGTPPGHDKEEKSWKRGQRWTPPAQEEESCEEPEQAKKKKTKKKKRSDDDDD